jgi:hypothetical protein
MRILLIGDLNSSFVRDYALNLKSRNHSDLQIDLFATVQPMLQPSGYPFEKIFSYRYVARRGSNKKLNTLFRTVSLFKFLLFKSRSYNFIHIHYLLIDFIIVSLLNRLLKNKVIITIYGSDFYKIKNRTKQLFTPFFRHAFYVTFANENTALELRQYYRLDEHRIRICRFGLTSLEKIQNLHTQSTAQSREILGLPIDKLTIAVGYNYNKDQQHHEIFESLADNKNLLALQDKINFVVPLTYGTEHYNKQQIIDMLNVFPYSATVFSEFLNEEKLANLRIACDIMIQVQKSDQFSGSMQEHLFAGNVVITGSWLPYGTFQKAGVYFRQIDNISELGNNLFECIMDLAAEKEKSKRNREIVYQLSSWNNTIDAWKNLYTTKINDLPHLP